ncbi:MAG: hypothetical protein OWU84_04085 [Firmicutes bacterium]|nr:hypothetical protein [Bacillota bacterium]
MPNLLYDIVGLGLFVVVIIRQVTPRRPTRLRLYILPLLGLYWAYHTLPHPVPPEQIGTTLISVGVSIPFAIMQGYFTRLYEKAGQWVLQGDWRYLVSWLVIFALHGVIAVVLHQTMVITWEIALEIAIVWGLRSVVLHLRYPQLSRILAKR